MLALLCIALIQQIDSTPPRRLPRTIAIDERLAADGAIRVGDRLVLSSSPGGSGDSVVVSALVRRRADPSEVARAEYRVRLHLDQLQSIASYGDRVDRFAIASASSSSSDSALRRINDIAYGFRAFKSRDIAV